MPHQAATAITSLTRSGNLSGSSTNTGLSQVPSHHGGATQGMRFDHQRFIGPTVRQTGRKRPETFVGLSEINLTTGTKRNTIKLDSGQQENYPASAMKSATPITQAYLSPMEGMLVRIARLQPGWAGSPSLVPPEGVQTDLSRFASYLPASLTAPEVEIDPEDGSVTLLWQRTSFPEDTFAVVFTGSGFAIGVSPSDPDYKPWRLAICDEWSLLDHLEDERALGSLLS